MSSKSNPRGNHSPVRNGVKTPSVSQLLGAMPTLPGESTDQYHQSLLAMIDELQATTVLQIYVAEKIHECLWWIRRYEKQKRATIFAEMASITKGHFSNQVTDKQEYVRDMLMLNKTSAQLQQLLASIRHTPESLQQLAMQNKSGQLAKLDSQIALQTKILAGLQASYEVAFNRKALLERLQLQNDLLRRDLQAIDVSAQ